MNPRLNRTSRLLAVLMLVSLLGGCAMVKKYSDMKPPRVTLSNLSVLDMTLFEQRFQVALRLQNPNDFALPITGLDYELQLAGQEFAHGVTTERITIPANGEVVVQLPVVTNLMDSVNLVRRLTGHLSEALSYSITGHISVAGVPLSLPFAYTGELQLGGGKGQP